MKPHLTVSVAIGLLALAGPAAALTLEFPGAAAETGARVERMTSYLMPVGPFADGAMDTRLIEGRLDQRAWRFAAPGRSTLELLQPLREQVTRAGFTVIFECEAVQCGGFDFRYGTEVLPEPEMHVDLGDFRYLAAERLTAAGPEYLSLIVSRAVDQGFVQIIEAGHAAARTVSGSGPFADAPSRSADVMAADGPPAGGNPVSALPATVPAATPDRVFDGGSDLTEPAAPSAPDPRPLAERLTLGGAQVLPDLVFESGSASLAEGAFASLAELAGFLKDNPGARVALVGHTDASGDLAANIALSRERARSVRQRLLGQFDIPAPQVDAEGVGYLAPRAPNDTDAGRLANRRVEVMLLATGAE